jgi:hypothetical protein
MCKRLSKFRPLGRPLNGPRKAAEQLCQFPFPYSGIADFQRDPSTRDVVQARLRRCGARMSGTNIAAAFVSRPIPDGCIRNQNQLLIRLHRHRHHLHRGYEVQRRFYSLQLATTSRCWYWQPTKRAQTCHRCRLHLISAPQMRAVAPGRVLDQVRGVKRCFPDRWGRFWQ